jgi:hypothetical protein
VNRHEKKIVTVSFDLTDPLERELLLFAERRTRHPDLLIKHLLFAWRQGWLRAEATSPVPAENKSQTIRKSGIPFG